MSQYAIVIEGDGSTNYGAYAPDPAWCGGDRNYHAARCLAATPHWLNTSFSNTA